MRLAHNRPHQTRPVRPLALQTIAATTGVSSNSNRDSSRAATTIDSNEVVAHVDVDEQRVLVVNYRTKQLKTLRVAVKGFFDSLDLVLRTVDEFDPELQ